MNKEPTQEQIKEFWEWCGFKHPTEKQAMWAKDPAEWWLWSDNLAYARPETPKLDLNNLFKYVVPEVMERNQNFVDLQIRRYIAPGYDDFLISYTCEIYSDNGQGSIIKQAGTPALALFWAIYELIDKSGVMK